MLICTSARASAPVHPPSQIGEGAQIAAGSLVLKEVSPHAMVAGSPAKEVGRVSALANDRVHHYIHHVHYEYMPMGVYAP